MINKNHKVLFIRISIKSKKKFIQKKITTKLNEIELSKL